MTAKERGAKLLHAMAKAKSAKIRMLRNTAAYHRWLRKAEYHKRMLDIEREYALALAAKPLTEGRMFRRG